MKEEASLIFVKYVMISFEILDELFSAPGNELSHNLKPT